MKKSLSKIYKQKSKKNRKKSVRRRSKNYRRRRSRRYNDGTKEDENIQKFFRNFMIEISIDLPIYDSFSKMLSKKKYPLLFNIINTPYKIIQGSTEFDIKTIDYSNDIFNEYEEKYLYHGTKSTFEIIESGVLKKNNSATGSGIFFGRTFLTSFKYADNMKSSNIKSSKNPISSVLIMKKQKDLEFKKNDEGLLSTKEYILYEDTYDLIENLQDIVFLRKIDIDNFFKKFDSFSDDMKKKLKTINIYQYDYNPLSKNGTENYKIIREQFFNELNKNSELFLNDSEFFNFICKSIYNPEIDEITGIAEIIKELKNIYLKK